MDNGLGVGGEAEPLQVLQNAFDELWATTAGVQILDPQQELPSAGPGMGVAECRGKGVTQVKPAGRRRGETCDLQDSLHSKGDKSDS